MADNVPLSPGAGPINAAADDIASVHFQRVKLIHGVDGVNDGDVALTNPLPVKEQCATATLANVASSASNVVIQALNTARRGLMVHNDSTATLYLKFGTTASLTSYTVKIPPDGYYELPLPTYTGVLNGIWSSANGSARVTELT